MCVLGSDGGQGRVSDPLELKLQPVGTHHVVLGIELGSLEEQPVLLIIEPSLQPSENTFLQWTTVDFDCSTFSLIFFLIFFFFLSETSYLTVHV